MYKKFDENCFLFDTFIKVTIRYSENSFIFSSSLFLLFSKINNLENHRKFGSHEILTNWIHYRKFIVDDQLLIPTSSKLLQFYFIIQINKEVFQIYVIILWRNILNNYHCKVCVFLVPKWQLAVNEMSVNKKWQLGELYF